MTTARSFTVLCTIGVFCFISYNMVRMPVLALFAESLGASPERIGLIVSVSTLTGVFLKLPSGALSDIYGRRMLLRIGVIAFGVPPCWGSAVRSPQPTSPTARKHNGAPTPAQTLNLKPGEWVRVRPHEEILKTVTVSNRNRGMFWDAELVPYCGGEYKVLKRVDKLIDEKTGTMLEMKTPCIILDSVVCQARYSDCRMLCPKGMYPYWREIWLERVEGGR